MHDDKLILYFYDDGLSASEKQEVAAALEKDADLRGRYQALRQQLSGIGDDQVTTVPTHVVARWHDSIDRAARAESSADQKQNVGFNFMSFFWGAAITASLAVGVAIGVYISGDSTSPPLRIDNMVVDTTTAAPQLVPAAFTRGLAVHLRDSQRDIAALPVQSEAERILLIGDILRQNRLFERTAEQKNSPKLARVLRAFDAILVRLAAEDIAPEDAEALRAQLAFELNVMLTKLSRDASEEAETI